MTYSDHVIEHGSACPAVITLPCFSGDDDFYVCARMNDFYSSAAGDIYAYALSLAENAPRRARFFCTYEIADDGDGTTVALHLSFSAAGERTRRRTVTHVWKDGFVVSKSVS